MYLKRRVLLVLALLASAGCLAPPCERRPPNRIQFLLVNDVYQLEPDAEDRGGLARVATLVRQMKRETPHTLFALAGDTVSPSLLSTLFKGRHMVDAWNALGLDVATFGNHEFDFGPAVLRDRVAESAFLWLSANVREAATGRPFGGARPWLVRDFAGARIGLIGLTTPDTAHTSNPGADVSIDQPVPRALAAFDDMGPVALRVALTHLEIRADRELAVSVALHLILGGHDHDPMIHAQDATLIIKAGADAVNVGQVVYDLGCAGSVLGRRQRLIPIGRSLAEAPDITALVRRYAALADRELDTPVGRAVAALDARETVVRRQETPLGRFFAEVMRERVDAEIGLLNGGAIRGNRLIPPGPLTRRDVRALLPFDNTLVVMDVTGAALRQALEHSLSALPRPAGRFLQTAGLAYLLEPDQPPGRRVARLEVQGQPVEPARYYRVAMSDFLARGGDGYSMLAQGRVIIGPESGPGMLETVLEALQRGRSP